MKECMQMLARIDREKLVKADTEPKARHYEHLICKEDVDDAAPAVPRRSRSPQSGPYAWQFI
jgi:hypothetical protein